MEDSGSYKPWGYRMADGAAKKSHGTQRKMEDDSDVDNPGPSPGKVGDSGARACSFLELPRRHPGNVRCTYGAERQPQKRCKGEG